MIDAHQHLWQLGNNDCEWPTADLTSIYRDFEVKDLLPLTRECGVTGTVLVQSQTSDADTDYLLRVADQSDLIKAVVGWVDLASPEAPERIARLAVHPKFRGIRPMLQSLPDDAWILRAELEPAIAAMKAHHLSLDALVYTRHLEHLYQFARRHPALPIVIDHAAKPAIIVNDLPADEWCEAMRKIARLPQVHCKLSGLVTEAGKGQGVEVFKAYIKFLVTLFGPERLMWGSDWPVIRLAPNPQLSIYKNWLDLVNHALVEQKITNFESVFIGTSLRFYRIT
ncbi:MAG TPA: amidohydrolase family protein [Cellvibrio sp.]|nr:amidohydrolase family protein [Cellvibrio sp.]